MDIKNTKNTEFDGTLDCPKTSVDNAFSKEKSCFLDTLLRGYENALDAIKSYFLPLTGGTLTGDITRSSSSTTENFIVKRSDLTKGTAPSGAKYIDLCCARDSGSASDQNNRLAIIENTIQNTGSTDLALRVYKFMETGAHTNCALRVGFNSNGERRGYSECHFLPGSNNTYSLGTSTYRWTTVYATTGTIDTSDERLKDNIATIPNEVLDAWGEVGWYQFQFKDSIAEKGKNARIHCGTIAQRIKEVFEAHNLDAFRYGLLCYDEWDAEEEEKDENGNVITEAREAGNCYSLRYEEALCMEAAYQRRRADRLEARILALEEKLK